MVRTIVVSSVVNDVVSSVDSGVFSGVALSLFFDPLLLLVSSIRQHTVYNHLSKHHGVH